MTYDEMSHCKTLVNKYTIQVGTREGLSGDKVGPRIQKWEQERNKVGTKWDKESQSGNKKGTKWEQSAAKNPKVGKERNK